MNKSMFDGPTLAEVDGHIDTLDRTEPTRSGWQPAFNALHQALGHARKVRRYCVIPAAVIAAALIIVFHGEVWNWDDARNLLAVELILLGGMRFAMTKVFAVLDREDRVQALLRYYGAKDLPYEDEAPV